MAILCIPWTMIDRESCYPLIRIYCRWVRFSLAILVGLKSQIRGAVPSGDVLICSKHQSFLDILILCSVLDRPRFVMKKQMATVPIVGYFAKRIGCISVDRGKKRLAMKQLLKGTKKGLVDGGQLVIFPQGTRVNPGAKLPYKIGAGLIYETFNLSCIPVATNVGIFWPRRAFFRKRGLAIMEFLPAIRPGLSSSEFMERIEVVVETRSDQLMQEAVDIAVR